MTSSLASVKQDLRATIFLARVALYKRYTGSILGIGWSLLNPITQIFIFWFVFGYIMKAQIPNYVIFLSSGILPWSFMSSSLQISTGSLLSRRVQLNASNLPYWVFIAADVSAELLAFLIGFTALIIFTIVYLQHVSWAMLFLPLAILPLVIFTYATSFILAYLTPWFRDIPHLLQVGLSAMFWLVPIAYHWSMVPPQVSRFVKYNPLALLISPVQVVMHGQTIPTPELMMAGFIFAVTMVVLAYILGERLKRETIYRI